MTGAVARLLFAWGALLLLLGGTFAVAHLPLGLAKVAFGYAIAAVKAGIILWVFMEMRGEGATARMATMAIWVFIMLVLTGSDYVTRAMTGG